MKKVHGYQDVLLDIDLSSGQINKKEIDQKDLRDFIGGRGLGMKLLWDALPEPGVDPLSQENLYFLCPDLSLDFPYLLPPELA